MEAQAQQAAVAVEVVPSSENCEALHVLTGEGYLAKSFGLRPNETDYPARRTIRLDGLHPHGLIEERACQDLAFLDGKVCTH